MTMTDPEMSAPPAAEKLMKYLLKATQDGDYEAFILPGTEPFQQGMTPEKFAAMSGLVSARLKAGHATEFQMEVKSCEHGVFLWKLSFSDGGSQYIARLVITTGGQVVGFMLN